MPRIRDLDIKCPECGTCIIQAATLFYGNTGCRYFLQCGNGHNYWGSQIAWLKYQRVLAYEHYMNNGYFTDRYENEANDISKRLLEIQQ